MYYTSPKITEIWDKRNRNKQGKKRLKKQSESDSEDFQNIPFIFSQQLKVSRKNSWFNVFVQEF